jgi:hypothetical protein
MFRSALVSALVAATFFAGTARSEDAARPPVGGVVSPPDAMIFYLAHGPDGACGPDCSAWIAAEGVVQWDSFKRLFAFLARYEGRKLPIVLNVWGESNLNVATSLGKIIRDHGIDVGIGATAVAECANATPTACLALKRSGKPLDARVENSSAVCDVVCILILAGGVHRTLPAGAKVVIGPTHIVNRLAPNVSEERREGLQTLFSNQFRLYLTQMGVRPEVADIIERNAESGRSTQLSRDDWLRLGIVTTIAL